MSSYAAARKPRTGTKIIWWRIMGRTVTTVSRQANAKADAIKTTSPTRLCGSTLRRVASDLLTIHDRRPGGDLRGRSGTKLKLGGS